MKPGMASLLRVHVGESDHHDGEPRYQAIVRLLHDRGIAGVTVIRGIEGYGSHGKVHSARILSLSIDLPIIVEAVDEDVRLRAVLPELVAIVGDGLVTMQRVEVITHRPGIA